MSELWSHLVSWFASHGVLPVLQWLHLEHLAGPKRPQDRVALPNVAQAFTDFLGLQVKPARPTSGPSTPASLQVSSASLPCPYKQW